MHCQVETLRRCFPPSIRRILHELPKTLDETYERILMEIDKEKQPYANRLFQCLAISIRPLRVEELAEVFAILPNAESTPGFNIGWRPEDPEAFILSACSTLVSLIDVWGGKVVQFSHFSVRDYLTSARIADSTPVSHFHILPTPAHTLLATACLGVLLQLDYSIDRTKIHNFPLASYAAEHWVDHARFKGVSPVIQDGMDSLFDRNKPHLAAWIWLYDVEHSQRRVDLSPRPPPPDAVPLYYAALCGFLDLVERLLDTRPHDINARGGYHVVPLLAALNKEHLNIALLLLERGADMEFRGRQTQNALYVASSRGYTEAVQSLIDHGADLNVRCGDTDEQRSVKWTPLLVASKNGRLDISRVLLKHGADVNYQDDFGKSPLHVASRLASNDLARLLLNHGANLNALDASGETALHDASSNRQLAVAKLLLEYGANVDARRRVGWSLLHEAALDGHLEAVQLLLDHGADANARMKNRWTALHLAAFNGQLEVVEVLLERGADPHARTEGGETPFQLASVRDFTQIMRLLSDCTGERVTIM